MSSRPPVERGGAAPARWEGTGEAPLAGTLGHARGRWGALTRQATYAQLTGRAEEAARLGQPALELGRAIDEPDASGCFCTHR